MSVSSDDRPNFEDVIDQFKTAYAVLTSYCVSNIPDTNDHHIAEASYRTNINESETKTLGFVHHIARLLDNEKRVPHD